MMLRPRWRKVLRDLWSNKSRTILVMLSIAIGIFAFGGLFTARNLILESLDVEYQATNPSDIDLVIPNIDDLLIQYVSRQPYVTGVQTYTTAGAELVAKDGDLPLTQLISFESMADIHINTVAPEDGAFTLEPHQAILERSFLEDLNVSIGETITIKTSDDRYHDLVIVGTVHSLNINPQTITVPVWVSRRTLFNMGFSTDETQMELTVVRPEDPNGEGVPALADLATQIREDLREQGVTVASMVVNEDPRFWAQDIMDAVITVLVIIGTASLFLSAFLVINTISGIMAAQKKQIGIMKIIGADRFQIIALYLVMVAILGLVAFVIAIPITMQLAFGILDFFGNFLNYNTPEIYIPAEIVLIEFAMAIMVPVLSALAPVLSGTAITPADAISDYVPASGTNPVDNLLAKLGGLYRPVLVSIRNTFRKKTRLAITLFTLTVAGTVFISVMNVRNGLLANINDLLNMAQFDIQMSMVQQYNVDALERRVMEASPAVEYVESWTTASVVRERPDYSESENYTLTGMVPESPFVKPVLVEGTWLPSYDIGHRFNVVVPMDMIVEEPDLGVGSTLKLKFNGSEEDFTIVGILDTNGQPSDDLYAYYDTVARFKGTPNQTNLILIDVLETVPRSDYRVLADHLVDYLEDRGLGVGGTFLTTDIIDQITTGFNSLVSLLLGMAVLVAIVAGLGLTGTMSLNVIERTREIGVMRAVGAGSNAIRFMYVGEGVLIGTISYLIALPLSILGTIVFSNVLGDVLFGAPLTVIVTPLGVIVWGVIVFSVSSLASITPANRASQISIREAISYE
jgi:putative ABC transport system permease protein